MHDDFIEVDEVCVGFHEKMDGSDMGIIEHLIVDNEITDDESFSFVNDELHIVANVNMVLNSHVLDYGKRKFERTQNPLQTSKDKH